MKQLTKRIFPLFLSLILMLSAGMTALASGEGNLDGGGGGMGSGTATDVWHGQDGVRVTVVTADGSVVSTPFDLGFSSQVSVLPEASMEAGMNSLSGSRVRNQAPASTATQSADKPQMVKVLFLSVGLFFFII